MGEVANSAITGIRDPEREGFIASTLFSQGWNITLRALDFDQIDQLCSKEAVDKATIILATDLEGLTPAAIAELKSRGYPVFLFAPKDSTPSSFAGVQEFPTTALELISLMRGSLRAPMIRAQAQSAPARARTIALAASASSSGCTQTAINLATELSLLGKRTLLVDAHAQAPAISSLLGQRGLRASVRHPQISENLWGMEISQANLESDLGQLHSARSEFDFIVIDLGTLRNIAAQLTGKRWESEAFIWSSTFADELWLLSKGDQLSLERLRELLRELSQNSIKPALVAVQSMRTPGKKNSPLDQSFIQSISAIKPARVIALPTDSRSVLRAESERSSLYEVNERSHLRRCLAEIAGQLIS